MMYLGDWQQQPNRLPIDFEITTDELTGCEILLAYYSYENYVGDAFVLFRRDGKLYEVNGSHCSCYGLEGQWNPEETTEAALMHRMQCGLGKDTWYHDEPYPNQFHDELKQVLDAMSVATPEEAK